MVGAYAYPVQQWNLGIGPISCHAWNRDRTSKYVCSRKTDLFHKQIYNARLYMFELYCRFEKKKATALFMFSASTS